MRIKANITIILFFCSFLTGCATVPTTRLLDADKPNTQLQLRSMQTRDYPAKKYSKSNLMRGVISTLQDLNFVLDKADYNVGVITATKFMYNRSCTITVTVRDKNQDQKFLVRANAEFCLRPVESPEIYQDFFAALSKNLFTEDLG